MSSLILTAILSFSWLPSPAAEAIGSERNDDGAEVLSRYLEAYPKAMLRGVQMEVDIDARLVKLNKQGTLHALRSISTAGQVAYDSLRWGGDTTIKKDVISRFLSAEVQSRNEKESFTLTPANYRFKYKGLQEKDGVRAHVFQVTPRRKAEGLFRGELWIDPESYLPLRETGTMVKSPSVFLKKIEFTRDFQVRDGAAFPSRLVSTVYTRIAGRAELDIRFSNVRREGEVSDASLSRPPQP